jgi:serine protease Do
MDESQRAPCPHCGEAASVAARICPRCQHDVTVDLFADGPACEPRAAYAAARDVDAVVPGALQQTRRSLVEGQGALLAGITRETARDVVAVLEDHSIPSRLRPHGGQLGAAAAAGPAQQRSFSRTPIAIAGAIAAALAVAWLWPRATSTPKRAEATATRPAPLPPRLSARDVGVLAAASTASLRCEDSLGTGFFVAPDLLVTNAHVLCGDGSGLEVVLGDGQTFPGMVERRDSWLDLALVRVDGFEAPPLPLGDASPLAQGDSLYFYGSPRGLDFTLAQAMVSHAIRPIRGVAFVQLDGNVNPGNSGGPLLDPHGRVVGVVTAMVGEASGLGLALPVNYLYTGDDPMLPAPAGADFDGWEDVLAEVGVDEEREVAEAREQLERPALVSAAYMPDSPTTFALVALVARSSVTPPLSETFDFELERGGEVVCTPIGAASNWRPAGTGASGLDDSTRQWLERHRLSADIWVAAVPVAWATCPVEPGERGVTLTLRQADGSSARAEVQAMGGMGRFGQGEL